MPCLPIAAMWWFPGTNDDGPRRVVAPEGTPVHAAMSGRVTNVDAQSVGTVVIRDERERFHHYRRLQASTISVREHDEIDAGTPLGVVAPTSDGSPPALLYGVQRSDARWLDIVDLLLGAIDPADYLVEPVGASRVDPLARSSFRADDEPARPTTIEPAVTPIDEAPADERLPDQPEPLPDRRATTDVAAPSAAGDDAPVSRRPRRSGLAGTPRGAVAREPEPTAAPAAPEPASAPPPAPAPAAKAPSMPEPPPTPDRDADPAVHEDAPEQPADDQPKRSRLAARRPPKRAP